MDCVLRNDFAIDALVLEVDRQKKKRRTARYSYGRLVADTTFEQRQRIADRYAKKAARKSGTAERYTEPDDKDDINKIIEGIT